jgi:hypothetical protein
VKARASVATRRFGFTTWPQSGKKSPRAKIGANPGSSWRISGASRVSNLMPCRRISRHSSSISRNEDSDEKSLSQPVGRIRSRAPASRNSAS